MPNSPLVAVLCIAAITQVANARAPDPSEIDQLRNEIAELRSEYEGRIQRLEARLEAAEASPATNPLPIQDIAYRAAPPSAGTTASSSAFNPATSLILSGTYGVLQPNPDSYQVNGFFPPGDGDPLARGFNVGESELTLSANVDPYFSGTFTAAYDPDDGVSVEEAYGSHVGIVPGGSLKFGRFLSAVGYHNEIHAHAWDFVNAPLVYQLFFDSALAEDGLQGRWLAPTDTLLEFGFEVGNGANFPSDQNNKNSPNSLLAFVHLGGDVGDSSGYLLGASYRHSRADQRSYADFDANDTAVTNAFHGDTDLWGAQFVWKWSPNGNPIEHNLKLQAEYFARNEHGDLDFDLAGPLADSGSYDGEQSGWYIQAIYQFMARWRVGARYDVVDSGSMHIGLIEDGVLTPADFPLLADHDPTRVTTMLDFSPSEFSRLRLQYARGRSSSDSGTDEQLLLQYILSLGAHGGHRF